MNEIMSKLLLLLTVSLLPTVNGITWKWPTWPMFNGRLLNFFSLPDTDRCLSNDLRRTGLCLNRYECKILHGESHGSCAYGIGTCCVFTVTCYDEVVNNGTYFVNPRFPGVLNDKGECSLRIKIPSHDVSQIRLDFVNFNLAQPNRKTGVCETDKFIVTGGTSRDLKICGVNTGQHVYYDLDNMNDVTIQISLGDTNYNRMWEIKITQVEFSQRASEDCVQHFQGVDGIVQTMNYAINGRHLADQNYFICIRQEKDMCSIVYQPCDENSFKVGKSVLPTGIELEGSGDGNRLAYTDSFDNCKDRVTIACDTEDLLTNVTSNLITCDLLSCGNHFCSNKDAPCLIESTVTPFMIKIQFGPGAIKENPEDNLGVCIKYQQQQCSP